MRLLNWLIAILVVAALIGGTLLLVHNGRPRTPARADNSTFVPEERLPSSIDPASAPASRLLEVARKSAHIWRPDAELVGIKLRPEENGLINLTRPGPGADFWFHSPAAGDSAGVMFGPRTQITRYPNAAPVSTAALPAHYIDIADVLARRRRSGWQQHIRHAILSVHQKKNFPTRLAWVFVGDGTINDGDPVCCIDALSGNPFLSSDIEDSDENPGRPSMNAHWLDAPSQIDPLITSPPTIAWQSANLSVTPAGADKPVSVVIPIRPFTDTERASILNISPDGAVQTHAGIGAQSGPLHALTPEQRRVFRSVFGQAALDLGVEPSLVICDGLRGQSDEQRQRVREAVESEYHNRYGGPASAAH